MARNLPCKINGIDFGSQKAAAEYFGVRPQVISKCLERGNEDNLFRYKGRRRSAAKALMIGPVTFPSRVEAARLLGISTAVLYKCLHPNATPQQKQSLLVRVMKFDMAQQKERQNER